MKRLIPSIAFTFALLLLPSLAWAQQGTISGTVTDAQTGDPLPGATVQIPETGAGAATASDGQFSLRVAEGQYEVRVSFIGYQTVTRDVNVNSGSTTEIRIQLQPSQAELEEVVVTALGAERDRDELGASQSTIDAEEIAASAEESVTKALSAKAAGLQVSGFGGDPGTGARITIRGNTSIQGDNQPLIVVDGQPISNETFEQGFAGVQQQSRLNDLNPEDVASVEVLKGASAAALWGSRAQNGVILIETNQGTFDQSGTRVNFKSSFRYDEQNQSQELQEAYGQGIGGYFSRGTSLSWGDRIADRDGGEDDVIQDGPVAVGQQTGTEYRPVPAGGPGNPHGGKNSRETYDNSTRLFDTGTYYENSLSISGGGESGRYYLSIGNTVNNGIIPENSDYERTSIRLNAERRVTNSFKVKGNVNYIKTNSNRVQQGSNLDGLLLGAYRTPADFDNTDYRVDYYPQGLDGGAIEGLHRSFNGGALGALDDEGNPTGPGYANPRFTYNETTNHAIVNRIQGKVEGTYQPVDRVDLTARVGVDTYTDRRNALFPVRSSGAPTGYQEEQQLSEYRFNADVIAEISQPLTDDIGSNLTLGMNFNHQEYDEIDVDLNNFSNPVRVRDLGNAAASDVSGFLDKQFERTASVYGEARFDLFDQLFVTGTGRVDQASTFGPEADNTFFYPSATVAWQFHKILPESDILSFGKLRGSVGQVGNQPAPYQNITAFTPGGFFDGFTGTTLQASGYGGGFERSNNLGNSFISPEKTTEYEVGTDLRFFDDRFRFTGTYYYKKSTDVIFSVSTAPSSGFTSRTNNVAEITNEGYELQLGADWITGESFQWTSDIRWDMNENIVQDLAGVEEVSLDGFVSATSSVVEGEEFGVIYGQRWDRNDDGSFNLDANGFPQQASTQGVIGNPNPDWNLGVTNTFSYEGFTLDVLIDYKHGGDVWNGTRGALSFFGRHGSQDFFTTISEEKATNPEIVNYFGCTVAQLAEQTSCAGFFSSNARQNDDGTYSFRGELRDFGDGERVVDGPYFYSGPGSGFTGPAEQFIEDGGFFRLRRVGLSYTWDSDVVQDIGLQSINLSATARNLVLITDYSGIDPETNLTGPSNGQGLDYFNNPNTRSYQFTIRLNY